MQINTTADRLEAARTSPTAGVPAVRAANPLQLREDAGCDHRAHGALSRALDAKSDDLSDEEGATVSSGAHRDRRMRADLTRGHIGGLRLKSAWRPGSESNRRTRLCRPLHDHSATWPVTYPRTRGRERSLAARSGKNKKPRRTEVLVGFGHRRTSYSRLRVTLVRFSNGRCTSILRRTPKRFEEVVQPEPDERSTRCRGVEPDVERETRLELATPTLARSCSTN